jgi:hypothetical protein
MRHSNRNAYRHWEPTLSSVTGSLSDVRARMSEQDSIWTNWPASSRRAALGETDNAVPHRAAVRPRGSTGTPRAVAHCAMEALAPGAGPPYGLRGQPAPPAPLATQFQSIIAGGLEPITPVP